MTFFSKIYRILTMGLNIAFGCLFLLSAYSYLIPPDSFVLPHFLTLAFPVFFIIEIILLVLYLFVPPKKCALLHLFFLLLAFKPVQNYFPTHFGGSDNGEPQINLISYNVCGFQQESRSEMLDLLAQSEADIICLQEFNGNRKKISQILSAYPYHHYYYSEKIKSRLACYSKFPIKRVEPIPFANSTNSACLYQIDVKGHKLVLINCHLESNHLEQTDRQLYTQIAKHPGQSTELLPQAKDRLLRKLARASRERARQARLIRKIADDVTEALVICGDFNDTPQSYAYRTIRGSFEDAYIETGFGPGITYNTPGFWFRIDHILYNSALHAIDCRVIHEKLSDHYPIQAVLQWNKPDN